jgi:putative hydrolase of the HAD superfamily
MGETMIRAVLFDLDNTLIDFDPRKARDAFRAGARRTYDYLKERDLAVPEFEKFLRTHRSLAWRMKWVARLTRREQSVRHVLRKLCLKLRLQRDEVSLSRLGWIWYEPLVESATVAGDVLPTLATLQQAGIKLGIICNTPLQGDVIDKHLRLEGLFDFFSVRIYSSDVGYRKPDARIFQAALNELNVQPEEAMYVGDIVKTDAVGAYRARLRSVLKQQSKTRPCDEVDHVIASISDLLNLLPIRAVLNATPPPQPKPRAANTSAPAKTFRPSIV